MKPILTYLTITLICISCKTNPKNAKDFVVINSIQNTQVLNAKSGFNDFVKGFNQTRFPFEIGDSILWKSTLVEMQGLEKIDTKEVDKYLNFEYEKKDSIDFHQLIRFYKVGQIPIGTDITGIIYLKSYKSRYVHGGKKDIYKIATFDSLGNMISQLNIAGFMTDLNEGDDRSYWNRCQINKNLNVSLMIKKQRADYSKDTLYAISEIKKQYFIDKHGKIYER